MSCPSCAGSLRITEDIERFSCKYCGQEHLIRRSHGQLTLVPVIEKLERIDKKVTKIASGADRHASELAIVRLRKDWKDVKKRADEWDEECNELKATQTKAQGTLGCSLVFVAMSVLVIVVSLFLSDARALTCIAVVVLLFALSFAGPSALRIGPAKRKLLDAESKAKKQYRKLTEIDEELEHHLRNVRLP